MSRPDRDVESLVRDHLAGMARTVDPELVLDAVRGRLAFTEPTRARFQTRQLGRRRFGRLAATAAAAVLLVGLGWQFHRSSARLEAAELVREAHVAFDPRVDRLYQVHLELAPGAAERMPFLAGLATFDARLWTRGDRFAVEASRPDMSWSFGRDESGRAWLVPTADVVLGFNADELPQPVAVGLELCRLDLESILGEILSDFDVREVRPGPDGPAGVVRVRGMLKPGKLHPRQRAVTLDIDPAARLVRRAVVSRMHNGASVAEVSFTLVESSPRPDSFYRIEGRSAPGAAVVGSDQQPRRRRQLLQFLGSILVEDRP